MPSVFYEKIDLNGTLEAAKYDALLAGGWYRVQQLLMTTDFIMMEGMKAREENENPYQGKFHYLGNELAPVFWLRINLPKIRKGFKHKHQNFITQQLRCEQGNYEYRGIDESLYTRYRASIDFDASETLYNYLFEEQRQANFSSNVIRLFDKEELVACGIFDEAGSSIAGIINFFDPNYKKYSLGKWLIQKKIAHCIEEGKAFYYPGYFSTRVPKFDYKLGIAPEATEVWIREARKWIPLHEVSMADLEYKLINVMASIV